MILSGNSNDRRTYEIRGVIALVSICLLSGTPKLAVAQQQSTAKDDQPDGGARTAWGDVSRRFVVNNLGVCFLISSVHPTHGQDVQPDLNRRLRELEQRVGHTRTAPFGPIHVTSRVGVAEAESRLAAAEQKLQYTEILHRKGFVTELQLEAHKFAVAQARKELQLAKSAQKDRKTVLEIAVLDAEHNLAVANEHLKHSERLREKGFVSELQVKGDKLQVEKVGKRLERAKAKLRAYERSLKNANNQD